MVARLDLVFFCMKIVTWNVRGLDRPEKKKAVRRLFSQRKCDMIFIQESKLEAVDSRLWRVSTEHRPQAGEFVSSVGAAGGLISMEVFHS